MKDEYEFGFKNFYYGKVRILWISQVALVVKNLPANAEDTGSIPGLGRAPRGGNGTPLQYFCLKIPWAQESGGLQLMGPQRVRHN